MRIQASCPLGTCTPLWTIDLIANVDTDAQAEAQAQRCIADHIRQAHSDTLPVVTVTATPG